ncbi:MAG: hypothetical protein HKO68_04350, partial [Desulfobacterales bacterium]|nr:hypothetical protein [Desulfobacterales bacterium]
EGPLACERIVDTLEDIAGGRSQWPQPPFLDQLGGWCRANWRHMVKWCKSHLPESKYRPEFQRHRYPGLNLEELRERMSRFQEVLGHRVEMKAEQISDYIYRITAI